MSRDANLSQACNGRLRAVGVGFEGTTIRGEIHQGELRSIVDL